MGLPTYLGSKVNQRENREKKKIKDKQQKHIWNKKKRVLGIGDRPTGLCTNDEFKVLLTSHIQATEEIKSRLLPKFKF